MIKKKLSDRLVSIKLKLQKFRIPARIIFFVTGIASTIWFLIRVIPKPSRASYPCMKAAAPIMSGFVVYLMALAGSVMTFKIAKRNIKKNRYLTAVVCITIGIVVAVTFYLHNSRKSFADPVTEKAGTFSSNEPIGIPQGLLPGRVAWAWDRYTTNPYCTNTPGDGYFMDKNVDQAKVDNMVREIVLSVTGRATEEEAWDALFRYHNNKKGLGDKGYSAGQTIFIKVNQGNAGWAINSDLTRSNSGFGCTETSPQVIKSILKQLVYKAGVPQEDILVGEPIAHIFQENYEIMHADFPNVKYVDKGDYANLGRTKINPTANPVIKYSDKGHILAATDDKIYDAMDTASYMINLAALKGHERAGITLCAKNHFGSHTRSAASHLHYGLEWIEEWGGQMRDKYGLYRVLTDLMGHEKLGGNTMLFLVDGLWGGPEATMRPIKWAFFGNNWPNSILASQDEVALESVCYDLLRTEFTLANHPDQVEGKIVTFPQYSAVDDYLHQAADSAEWPTVIFDMNGNTFPFSGYDPEGNGTNIKSLGVHEHWNNSTDLMYSRNLGTNSGIELTKLYDIVETDEASSNPVIDGLGDDACWQTQNWVPIDITYIPYLNSVYPSDFSGRYKVTWNADKNLLYVLVEITDDTFIDGYVYNEDPSVGGGYYNYDVVELFIDEDHSGGHHIFDNNDPELGPKAANAFSYHIAANAPADGEVTHSMNACDIKGTNYGYPNEKIADYSSHFPEFALRKNGNIYTYEFSLNVYSDKYSDSDPEASRVQLAGGKKMGFAMAYCENDQNDGARDNFFGSVYVPADHNNDLWMNADFFGTLILKGTGHANQPPEILKGFKDIIISSANTDYTISSNLDEHFNDPEIQELTYSVISNNPHVTATINGKALTVNSNTLLTSPVMLTITASDGELKASTTAGLKSESTEKTNLPPDILKEFSDFEITELNKNYTITSNLYDYFEDPEGRVLIFTASSDEPALLVTINNNKTVVIKATSDFSNPATVTILASDGKLSTQAQFSVSSPTGIAVASQNRNITIYPVPARDGKIYIKFSGSRASGDLDYTIIGLDGKILVKGRLNIIKSGTDLSVDVPGLKSGSYLLQISNSRFKAVKKFSIE